MDRFIDCLTVLTDTGHLSLKSNMDRFIVLSTLVLVLLYLYLKSNMDRFIDSILLFVLAVAVFKIQYG